jgi:hypothetical protein
MLRRRSRCGRAPFYGFFGDSQTLLRDRDPQSPDGLGFNDVSAEAEPPLDDHRYRPRQLGATAAESLLRRIKRHDSLIQTTVLHPRCLPSSLVERYPNLSFSVPRWERLKATH